MSRINEQTESPITPLSYRGLANREKVLKAVGEGNHLSRQICAASGLSIGEVAYEIDRIETAQNENELEEILITRIEPTFRAYFTPGNAPKDCEKLILKSGRIGIIKTAETKVSEEVWEQKRRECAERNKNPKPFIPPRKQPIEDGEILLTKGETMNKTQTTKEKMTAEVLETLAAQGLSQVDAAVELNVSYSAFTSRLAQHAESKAAWKRGVAKFQSGGAAKTETAKTDYSKIPVTPEEDEAFEAIESAQNPDESDESFDNQVDEVFERIQIKNELIEPQTEPQISNIQFYYEEEQHERTVRSNGASLTVKFDGNFFKLSERKRRILNSLADLVQAFEAAN